MKPLAALALIPLMLLAVPLALLRYIYAVFTTPDKALRIAVGFDQLANVALNGSEDETISSRAWRAQSEGKRWGCVLCRLLDKVEKDHCAKSRGV